MKKKKQPAPWRAVIDARWDSEETLSCGHKWHKPFCDKIKKHAKKRRCEQCRREQEATR